MFSSEIVDTDSREGRISELGTRLILFRHETRQFLLSDVTCLIFQFEGALVHVFPFPPIEEKARLNIL